jgi:hypothetical protein
MGKVVESSRQPVLAVATEVPQELFAMEVTPVASAPAMQPRPLGQLKAKLARLAAKGLPGVQEACHRRNYRLSCLVLWEVLVHRRLALAMPRVAALLRRPEFGDPAEPLVVEKPRQEQVSQCSLMLVVVVHLLWCFRYREHYGGHYHSRC